jgi:hypothetical protein
MISHLSFFRLVNTAYSFFHSVPLISRIVLFFLSLFLSHLSTGVDLRGGGTHTIYIYSTTVTLTPSPISSHVLLTFSINIAMFSCILYL